MDKISIANASINILLEVDGEIYLTAMKNDRLETIQSLVQASADAVVPTGKTQGQLNDFIGYQKSM